MKTTLLLLLSFAWSLQVAAQDPRTEEIEFVSHGAKLSGSIVFPSGDIHAAVVFIHGSGKQARNPNLAALFAREGIAALVYDKRGVGKSGGEYESNHNVGEQNLALLADDAAAALRSLAAHPALKGKPVGFAGISQAGWIAPLAAQRTDQAKFLLMWSGPVCKVSEEDIYSKYTGDANSRIRATLCRGVEGAHREIHLARFSGPGYRCGRGPGQALDPRLLDLQRQRPSIPVDLSIESLQRLRRDGHRYDYALFSGLGHDNMERTFSVATAWIRRSAASRTQ